jgi:hypothetical protein
MCHIFTGPSTALGDDSRAMRSCNASLHDMTTVEMEHIAYACIQVSFILLMYLTQLTYMFDMLPLLLLLLGTLQH